ncbi:PLP-dependent aminotransferase family protein [Leptospira fluminis]|uniref:PLP-dependent aminotransferase family protein n=1 Tax=Leptospira fluminis TaxID=2484979 RepID=A0A4R9GQ46_9LEPT|nr:PLP-dependent aminotransferase family protein [Leptospira fluminis]TGK17962.1 PLP-dependent aminotransferase family protein [Leptospira fluminis]
MTNTDSWETKYSRIARSLIERIKSGEFPPGTKLPSLRRICLSEQCNLSTAVEAFGILQEQGYIRGRERSGYFILPRAENPSKFKVDKPVRISNPSVPEEVGSLLAELADPAFISFGAAVPDDRFLPLASLERCYRSAMRDPFLHKYSDVQGHPELRRKISNQASVKERRISPEQVFVTVGCSEAAFVCLSLLTKAGDEVAVESPLHFVLYQILSILKLKAVEIPTDPASGMDLKSYEYVLKTSKPKLLITVPTFSNPTGSLMSAESKKELLRLSVKYGVRILEDDIYGELSHSPGPRPPSLLSLDGTREFVIQVSSLSKTVSPGLRIGWLIGDPELIHKAVQRRIAESIALPSLPQLAAANFLGSLGYERHIRNLKRNIGNSVISYTDALLDCFPKGTTLSVPKGGFLLWVELPEGKDSRELRTRAVKKRISLVPGNLFSLSGKYQRNFRINAGIPFGPSVSSAIRTLGRIAGEI